MKKRSPYLFILMGPTGSGKGSLPDKILNYLKINLENRENRENHKILIDDLVERNPYYIKKVGKYINKLKKQSDNVIHKFMNPDKDMIKYFNEVYQTGRHSTNCSTGSEHKINGTCEYVNDKKLENLFSKGKDIIFETTGRDFPYWLFDIFNPSIFRNNYMVIMAWSVVDICELFIRNKLRFKESIESYLSKRENKSIPRLPDIRDHEYRKSLKKIIEVYKNTLNGKDLYLTYGHKKKKIRILVFDNNKKGVNIIFDGLKNKTNIGMKAIDKYRIDKIC